MDAELRSFEPALLQWAMALTRDAEEARVLVRQTLISADEDRKAGPPSRTRLFRLLRQAYHSIERSRGRRHARDAAVTALSRETPPASAELR